MPTLHTQAQYPIASLCALVPLVASIAASMGSFAYQNVQLLLLMLILIAVVTFSFNAYHMAASDISCTSSLLFDFFLLVNFDPLGTGNSLQAAVPLYPHTTFPFSVVPFCSFPE
uniref:Uncharacterized protein n=1 Tax=Rhizophora mucronata TaxID=61149 RepID=A0A2P2KTT9_RHIMU